MSGETDQDVSSWTVDSLKEHVERILAEYDNRYQQRFDGQEKAINAALTAQDKAIGKQDTATEKRFDDIKEKFTTVNEFRGQLDDQARTFIPRQEADARMVGLEKEVTQLRNELGTMREAWANLAGKMAVGGAVLTVFISLVIVVVNLVFRS